MLRKIVSYKVYRTLKIICKTCMFSHNLTNIAGFSTKITELLFRWWAGKWKVPGEGK